LSSSISTDCSLLLNTESLWLKLGSLDWEFWMSVRNVVPTLTSRKRRGLSLNGRC
jgi:hypothetical protein